MRYRSCKNSLTTVLCVLACCPSLVVSTSPNRGQESESFAVVEGIVLDGASGLPIPQAQVSVVGTGPQVMTDESGRFTLGHIVPGFRRLEVAVPGYVTLTYGERRHTGRIPTIDLRAVQHRESLVLRVVPTGVISGRLYDLEGRPVVSGEVNAVRVMYDDAGNRYLEPAAVEVKSDDRGEYRLYDVEPGEYLVRAGFERRRRSASRISRATLAPTYYPGTTHASQAAPALVRPAEEVSAIDFGLPPDVGYTVSGRIVNQVMSSGVGRVSSFYLVPRVEHLSERPSLLQNEARLATRLQVFEIRGVPPGSYDLYALHRIRGSETNPGGGHNVGHSVIDIADRDVEGVSVVIEPGVTVSGRFLLEDLGAAESQPRFDRLRARLKSTDGKPPLAQPHLGRAAGMVASDATFALLGVFSRQYRITVQGLPQDFYLAEARLGSLNVLAACRTFGAWTG